MVFRAFLEQLPKLDVAGSTPVARSQRKPLSRPAVSSLYGSPVEFEVQSPSLDVPPEHRDMRPAERSASPHAGVFGARLVSYGDQSRYRAEVDPVYLLILAIMLERAASRVTTLGRGDGARRGAALVATRVTGHLRRRS